MSSTRSKPNLFERPTNSEDPRILQLMDGGRAGRIYSGHEERKEHEENDNAQWDMNPHPSTPCHDAHAVPLCLPCKQGAVALGPTFHCLEKKMEKRMTEQYSLVQKNLRLKRGNI